MKKRTQEAGTAKERRMVVSYKNAVRRAGGKVDDVRGDPVDMQIAVLDARLRRLKK